jgi:hypothetical protein
MPAVQYLVSYETLTDLHTLDVSNYEEFEQEVKSLYNLQSFSVVYFDDEGDCVKISSQPEFDEAMSFAQDNGNFLSIILEQRVAQEQAQPKEEVPQQPIINLRNLAAPFLNLLGDNSPLEPIVNEIADGAQEFINNLKPEDIEEAARNVHEWVEEEIPEFAQEVLQEIQERCEQKQPEPEAEPKVVHYAICDKCEDTIVGIRYKCIQCPDFDFCEACEGPNSGHDETHVFAKLYTREQSIPKPQKRCERKNRINKLELDVEALKQQVADLIALKQAPPAEPEYVEEEIVEEEEISQPEAEVEQPEAPISPELQEKLDTLNAMGFMDNELNKEIIMANNGDMEVVLDLLLASM